MQVKKMVVLLSTLAGVCIAAAACTGKNEAGKGMFEWSEERIDSPLEARELAKKMSVDRWYQEFPEELDKEKTSDFVRTMKESKVTVYALVGSVEWGFEEDGESLISSINTICEYNESVDEEEQIAGIMADIEPYTSDRWKREPEKYMDIYVKGMKNAYKTAREKGLTMIVCIPRHYDDRGLTKQLEELIEGGCDEVAVMDYECGNEVEKIRTEAGFAKKYKKPLHCILEFQEVGKHGLTEDKTYHNKGLDEAARAWDTVDTAFKDIDIIRDYHWSQPVLEIMED